LTYFFKTTRYIKCKLQKIQACKRKSEALLFPFTLVTTLLCRLYFYWPEINSGFQDKNYIVIYCILAIMVNSLAFKSRARFNRQKSVISHQNNIGSLRLTKMNFPFTTIIPTQIAMTFLRAVAERNIIISFFEWI
jgi:hypothetical protein